MKISNTKAALCSTQDTVLSALSSSLGHRILYSFCAFVVSASESKTWLLGSRRPSKISGRVFICLGQNYLYFVNPSPEKNEREKVQKTGLESTEFECSCIKRVAKSKDANNSVSVLLDIAHSTSSSQFTRFHIVLRKRQEFLHSLMHIWELNDSSKVTSSSKMLVDTCELDISTLGIEFIEPRRFCPPSFHIISYKGYSFLLSKEFVESSNSSNQNSDQLNFSKTGIHEFDDNADQMIIWISEPVNDREIFEEWNEVPDGDRFRFNLFVEAVANSYIEKYSNESEEPISYCAQENGKLLPSIQVFPKFQQSAGDCSLWRFHSASRISSQAIVTVIGARRQYLDPFLDEHQDLIFINIHRPDSTSTLSPEVCLKRTQDLAMSVRVEQNGIQSEILPLIDRDTVQTRLDYLKCSVHEFSWIEKSFSLVPQSIFIGKTAIEIAQLFSQSILNLLPGRESVLPLPTEAEQIQKGDYAFLENPLDIINRIEVELPGYQKESTSSQSLLMSWKQSVCKFLSYYLTESRQIGKSKISLDNILCSLFRKDCRNLQSLVRVVDYLLYIRVYGECFEFGSTFTEKLFHIQQGYSINEEVLIFILESEFRHNFDILRELVLQSCTKNLNVDELLSDFYISLLHKNYNMELFGLVCQKVKKLPHSHVSAQLFDSLLRIFESNSACDHLQSFAGETLSSLSGKLSPAAAVRVIQPAIARLNSWTSPFLLWSCLKVISSNVSHIPDVSCVFALVETILQASLHGQRHPPTIIIEAVSIFTFILQTQNLPQFPSQLLNDPFLLLGILIDRQYPHSIFTSLCETSDSWYKICMQNTNGEFDSGQGKHNLMKAFKQLKNVNWDFRSVQGPGFERANQLMILLFMMLNYFWELQSFLNVKTIPDSVVLLRFENLSDSLQKSVGFQKFIAALCWATNKNAGIDVANT